ncbi:MAG: prepilin peptidase [Firmicutes bacterium]|nr:prepilin peptidase [Bacillota bacterium]
MSLSLLAGVWWGVVGLALGSFLTVVIARLPDGRSVVSPPSHCPSCGHRLGPGELVPVVSYLAARGRCRHCGASIPAWYLAVELAAGAGSAALAWLLFPAARLYPALLLWLVGIAASAIDLKVRRIPNVLLAAAAAILAAVLAVGGMRGYLAAVEGAALLSAFGLLVAVVGRGGMGMGDVKYLTLVGAALGPRGGLVALYATMLTGGLYAIALLATGRARKGMRIAFAPFIAAGSMVGAVLGPEVWRWYGGWAA